MTSPDRIRIAVAGGGLIAQVEHLPNLLALRDRFELVAVSDPSATVRAALANRFGVEAVPAAEDLLGRPLDALLVAAPDPGTGRSPTPRSAPDCTSSARSRCATAPRRSMTSSPHGTGPAWWSRWDT
jgi:hypothetical protein